jgi:hypothetical protein
MGEFYRITTIAEQAIGAFTLVTRLIRPQLIFEFLPYGWQIAVRESPVSESGDNGVSIG